MTPIRCLNGIPALAPCATQEKQIRAAQRGEISCLHPSADALEPRKRSCGFAYRKDEPRWDYFF